MTEDAPRLQPGLIRVAVPLLAIAGIISLAMGRFAFALSLTAPSVAVIVHLLWLEQFLGAVTSGPDPKLSRKDHLKLWCQILLLAAVIALAHLWPGFEPLGMAVGISLIVVAVIVQGLRASA